MTTISLHEAIPGFGPSADTSYERLYHELLVKAYRFSDAAHAGQVIPRTCARTTRTPSACSADTGGVEHPASTSVRINGSAARTLPTSAPRSR